MANVHIRTIEDARGDLVDLEYFHHGCAPADVLGWPCPEALDYAVYCKACDERIYEVPLTTEGRLYEANVESLDPDYRAVEVAD